MILEDTRGSARDVPLYHDVVLDAERDPAEERRFLPFRINALLRCRNRGIISIK